MKQLLRIARTELALMFYSPVAWAVIIVFAFESAYTFVDAMQSIVSAVKVHRSFSDISMDIFAQRFFPVVGQNLYFYTPLLTMGLMSRETSSGSIRLLQSSPVTSWQIVFGKYVGIVFYGFLLMFILFLFVLAGEIIIVDADLSLILSGFFGLFLVTSAYFAIGLLVSCFTSYQVVAAIATFTILAALGYMQSLWQDVPLLRDLTYMLSINGRSDKFFSGLISTRDIVYYLLIIGLSLSLASFYLRSRQYRIALPRRILHYSLLVIAMLAIEWVSSRPSLTAYRDVTARGTQSVSTPSQVILKSIDGPLKVTTYVNLLDPLSMHGMPSEKIRNEQFFERYQRFLKHDIDMSYIYYYDSCENLADERSQNRGLSDSAIARKIAESRHLSFDGVLSPDSIRKQIDLSGERRSYVRLLQANGKSSWLRLFKDMFEDPGEAEVVASIKRLISGPVRVAIAVNNQQRKASDNDNPGYQLFTTEKTNRDALINQGFDLSEFSLDSVNTPPGTDILVIADPKTPISSIAGNRILAYIAAGGNLLVCGEPGRQSILNRVLAPLGVNYAEGKILQGSRHNAPDFILSHIDTGAGELSPFFGDLLRENQPVVTTSAMAILTRDSSQGFHIQPVLTTAPATWIRTGPVNADSGYVTYNPARDAPKRSYAVAVALSRPIGDKHQRIVVLGNADCLSNGELKRGNLVTANSDLAQTLFSWLGNDRYPIDTRLPPSRDVTLHITRREMPLLRTIFEIILPLLLLLAGGLLLLVRRIR